MFYAQQFSTIPFHDEVSGNHKLYQPYFSLFIQPFHFLILLFSLSTGEDEALEFARICFPAAAQALRWIMGICIGWGGESKRCEGEQKTRREREMLLLLLQMRAVGRRGRRGRREKGAKLVRSENKHPILHPEDRRCRLLTLREVGSGRADYYLLK